MPRTMKVISIHPFSALAGAALLVLVLMATGAVQVPGSVQRIPIYTPGLVHVAGIPDASQMIALRDGAPLVVPMGKTLVFTGIGGTGFGTSVSIVVDGLMEVTAPIPQGTSYSATVFAIPPGLAARAGMTVQVMASQPGTGRAWGYLADA